MSVRATKQMLADNRAMEEQAERYNPVNPKKSLGSRKGRTSVMAQGDEYSGGGATPSLGMSQFRGGNHDMDENGAYGESLVGAGKKKRKSKSSDAYEMGHHLSKHLHELHGSGFWDDFKSGFMSVVSPIANVAKAVLPALGPEGMAASGVMSAIGLGRKKRGGMVRKMKAEVDSDSEDETGRGNVSGPGYEAVSGRGTGGKRTNKRAEVVKRVMRDRGVSMIQASKIVKSEGLY